MRYPNNYGSVIKLSGKRRKKYAVRVSAGYRKRICIPNKNEYYTIIDKYGIEFQKSKNCYVIYDDNDKINSIFDEVGLPCKIEFVRKYKYIEYFEKSADAHQYLAKMNRGDYLPEHVSLASQPSFKDVYNKYIDFLQSLNQKPTQTQLRSYKVGFNMWEKLHDLRFSAITTQQLQKELTAHGHLAKSSVGKMTTIIKKMYKYALANDLCDKDLSQYLFSEHRSDKVYIHKAFTDDEIQMLWNNVEKESAKVILIMIYTGLRCSEFLQLENSNIYPQKRYLIGGLKTDAGKNRIIPIHKMIAPLIQSFASDGKYLYPNASGGYYTFEKFRSLKWNKWMNDLHLDHYTHDCRKTCATKLKHYGVSDFHRKLIIGHAINDLTDGTYTEVSPSELVDDIDLWRDTQVIHKFGLHFTDDIEKASKHKGFWLIP